MTERRDLEENRVKCKGLTIHFIFKANLFDSHFFKWTMTLKLRKRLFLAWTQPKIQKEESFAVLMVKMFYVFEDVDYCSQSKL